MKHPFILMALLALACGAGAQQAPVAKNAAGAEFDQLKSLVGEWEGAVTENGREMSAPITFRLASGGSVLISDLAPQTSHEMITMIHRDGGELMATHYCLVGNQPRMQALPSSDPKVVAFEFKDATNLPNATVPHMVGVKFTMVDANHHIEEWTLVVNGQSSIRRFECRRKT